MKNRIKKIVSNKFFQVAIVLVLAFLVLWFWPAPLKKPEYGLTFSAKYARELGLDPKEVLEETFFDLGVRRIRLVAYWDEIEKEKGIYDFSDLDWQIEMAERYNAEVILSIGRRVPRWPECHIPYWAYKLDRNQQYLELLRYVREVVKRYQDLDTIKIWQVENEPYLVSYAGQFCGNELRSDLLEGEIIHVRELDPHRQILVTDSGELGPWLPAYNHGDMFGSTFYVFIANKWTGDSKNYFTPAYYNFKLWLAEYFYGNKPAYLIEVSLEPWALKPLKELTIDEQLEKMSIEKMKVVLDRAARTNMKHQYLWGVEWWYYVKKNGNDSVWDFTKQLFTKK